MLSTMVTIARDHALESAERADVELRSGRRRSILHGLPYGVKDLLDTDGIRTTWGSGIFRDRVPTRNAAVIDRLADAGAVLMAKMSLGEFAGGNTSSALNPWKLDRTSFGSSSGTVSAAVAGLIGFGIGTETGIGNQDRSEIRHRNGNRKRSGHRTGRREEHHMFNKLWQRRPRWF